MSNCTRNTWVAALAAGLLVWLMALSHGGAGLIGGLFLGFVTAGLVGGLVRLLFCSAVGKEGTESVPGPAPTTSPAEPTMKTAPVAGISIARPQRPAGVGQAPEGASTDAGRAVTFEPATTTQAGASGPQGAQQAHPGGAHDGAASAQAVLGPAGTDPAPAGGDSLAPADAAGDPARRGPLTTDAGRLRAERARLADGGETAHADPDRGGPA